MSCRLYLISPPAITGIDAFGDSLRAAFSGGDIASFQLRLKEASDDEVLAACKALIPLCHAHECAFILNDRPDLAAQSGADGVHLGQEDVQEWPLARVRGLLGVDRVIGVSAHASRHLAMEAGEQGADYVAFGAFHPTKTKSQEKLDKWGTPTPDILEWWSAYTVLPCVAIGGITPLNAAPLARAGADFVAVVSAVWEHEGGPAAAVSAFNEEIKRTQ